MSDLIKIIILGIVEGVTEFLPISSTGHLIVAAALLDFRNNLGGTFEIFIQFGAVLAVIFFYRADLWSQVKKVPVDRTIQRFWFNIVIAVLPGGVVGFLLKDWVKANLIDSPSGPIVVAASLIVGGLIFLLIERRPMQTASSLTAELTAINTKQAVIVGIAQTLAFVPGVSRSGASIIGGMLGGMNRQVATQFSFYLAIPTLGGATLLDLATSLDRLNPDNLLSLFVGTVVSAVVAWLSIGWLLRYVSRNNFILFGYYRIAIGILILALAAAAAL